jgi:hypothetical protein
MSLLKLVARLALLIALTGCIENSEKVSLKEIGDRVYLIENNTGKVYWLSNGQKQLVTDMADTLRAQKKKNIIEDEFSLPNNLYIDGRFKITSGRVDYILELYDRGYKDFRQKILGEIFKTVNVEADTSKTEPDKEATSKNQKELKKVEDFDSDGFKVIQLITDRKNDDNRYDRINLKFQDVDGFTVFSESVLLTSASFTRLTAPDGRYMGLRLEGSIIGRTLSPDEVEKISHSYNGFTLD